MPKKGQTNFELAEMARKMGINLPLSHIIMRDEMAILPKEGDYLAIINLQDSSKGGSHWTAFVKKGRQAFHLDPFGVTPDANIVHFCHVRKLHLASNRYIIQDLNSDKCGLFCLGLFKWLRTQPLSRPRMYAKNDLIEACNDYVNQFVDDTKKNDGILMKWLRWVPKGPSEYEKVVVKNRIPMY